MGLRGLLEPLASVLTLAMLLIHGDDPKARTRPKDGLITRVVTLITPATMEKLNLTEEQRQQIDVIDQEFQQKRQQALTRAAFKLYGMVNAAEEATEPAPALVVGHEITGGLLETSRIRAEYEKRVTAVLNDQQRAEYLRLKANPPREVRESRKARAKEPRENLLLLMKPVQNQLGLSDEQKQKVEAIEVNTEAQIRALLTDQQRKKYDEIVAELRRDSETRPDRRNKNRD